MARSKSIKIIDEKIIELENKLHKLKDKCNVIAEELDRLYEDKREYENQEILSAIEHSSKTRAEIMAFLGSD
jgi:septal ring factor EnvC (AmiA/AmiB activator)